MSVYIVTGKLGNGKTLVTVGRIKEALLAGKRVATNLDLNLVNMLGRTTKKADVIRIPDKPTIDDFKALGRGYNGKYDESKFGALVLDECGSWFNSRNWQDKTRGAVNEWFLHSRKLGWDVYIIIQDISLLDSQAREAIAELIVYCRRLDKLRVPLIGRWVKLLTGINLKMPRMHRAKVVYANDDLISDVWWYRGNDFFDAYQTDQVFMLDYPHKPYCMLTPWHTTGRYAVSMTWRNMMRITKIYWRRFKSPVSLATGILLGCVLGFLRFAPDIPEMSPSVAEVAEVLPAEKQTDTRTESLIERLKSMVIKGSMTINGDYFYQFASEDEPGYLTDADFAGIGIGIIKFGPCRVEAYYDGVRVPITCL